MTNILLRSRRNASNLYSHCHFSHGETENTVQFTYVTQTNIFFLNIHYLIKLRKINMGIWYFREIGNVILNVLLQFKPRLVVFENCSNLMVIWCLVWNEFKGFIPFLKIYRYAYPAWVAILGVTARQRIVHFCSAHTKPSN